MVCKERRCSEVSPAVQASRSWAAGAQTNMIKLSFRMVLEFSDGQAKARGITGKYFRLDNLTSESAGRAKGEGAASWFKVQIDGREFTPTLQTRWKTNEQGMANLLLARRVQATKNTLAYVRYHDDFPAFAISNSWTDIGGIQSRADPKIYVVQTSTAAVQRCMLMTTDPGDLVLDPTCGSGTTAMVAENWGRRWITIDTSRVALALARQRIMASQFPYYNLADPHGDVRKGLVYKRVPHITLKSIATNPDIKPGMTRTRDRRGDRRVMRRANFSTTRPRRMVAKSVSLGRSP